MGVEGSLSSTMVETMMNVKLSMNKYKQEDSKRAAAAAQPEMRSRGRQTLVTKVLLAHPWSAADTGAGARATGQDAGMEKGMGNSVKARRWQASPDV